MEIGRIIFAPDNVMYRLGAAGPLRKWPHPIREELVIVAERKTESPATKVTFEMRDVDDISVKVHKYPHSQRDYESMLLTFEQAETLHKQLGAVISAVRNAETGWMAP